MAGKSPELDNQSYREKIPVVPIIDDGLVVMVGVDGGNNPDPNDFAGYDPSKKDVLQAWKDTYGGLSPNSESTEELKR